MKSLPRVIGLIGPKGSGKSEVAKILAQDFGYQRIAFADPLKLMLKAFGLTEDELWGKSKETPSALLCGKTPRWAMQTLGTEWGRKCISNELWTSAWQRMVLEGIGKYGPTFRVVVEDMRFVNEADTVRSFDGAKILWIDRLKTRAEDTHVSEQEWKLIKHDDGMMNVGTLKELAANVARWLA